MTPDLDIDDLRRRQPGEDPEDPYADVDRSELPDWWQEAIAEFEAAGLRPYRPPRFLDGEFTPDVQQELAEEQGVEVRFVCFGGRYGDDWAIQVDGEVIGKIARRRTPNGYTLFELTSEELKAKVRSETDEQVS